MKQRTNYEPLFWRILEKDRLVDLSQFHKSRFFDEVPLYSREADIGFLSDSAGDKANAILLRFSLKFLNSVIAYEEHRTPYFAAITVWSFSTDPIVPNLFVWSGPIRELEEKLVLNAVTTPFGRKIRKLVSRLRLRDQFEVLEETSTTPDTPRVFIGPSRTPYQGFVPLDTFRKPANASK